MTSLLQVDDLNIQFYPSDPDRRFEAVKNAEFRIDDGETLGVVGESGCGKSLSALSLLDLQPRTARPSGNIVYRGRNYEPGSEALHELRGNDVGMIFQEPMTALNPVYTVGEQIREAFKFLRDWDAKRQERETVEILERVHLDRPKQRISQYPHELSGGQRQRVMIALALAGDPNLLIADEPTTALDVTIESRIMNLFKELASKGLSILFISHDLRLVADISDRICVMYSGYSVESAPAEVICDNPQHPYTIGLMQSSAVLDRRDSDRLPVIQGDVPDPARRPDGCPFHPRCSEAEPRCEDEFPPEFEPVRNDSTACWAREGGPASS